MSGNIWHDKWCTCVGGGGSERREREKGKKIRFSLRSTEIGS